MNDLLQLLIGLLIVLLGIQALFRKWLRRICRILIFVLLCVFFILLFETKWAILCAFLPFIFYAMLIALIRIWGVNFPPSCRMEPHSSSFESNKSIFGFLDEFGYEPMGSYRWKFIDKWFYISIYWNPIDCATFAINLVERPDGTFYEFYQMDSIGKNGTVARTANIPLHEFLLLPPKLHRKYCSMPISKFDVIRKRHLAFREHILAKNSEELALEDPDEYVERIQNWVSETMKYNQRNHILMQLPNETYQYTFWGWIFVSFQVIRDMIRWF